MKSTINAYYIIFAIVVALPSLNCIGDPKEDLATTSNCLNNEENQENSSILEQSIANFKNSVSNDENTKEDQENSSILEQPIANFKDCVSDDESTKEVITRINEDDLMTVYPCLLLNKNLDISFETLGKYVSNKVCEFNEDCTEYMQLCVEFYGLDVLFAPKKDVHLVLENGSVKKGDKVLLSCYEVSVPVDFQDYSKSNRI